VSSRDSLLRTSGCEMELHDLLIKNVSTMFPAATFFLDFQNLVEGIRPGKFAAIVPLSPGVTIDNIVDIVVDRALLEGGSRRSSMSCRAIRPTTNTSAGTGQRNDKTSVSTNQRKEPRYTRVSKQARTTAKCNVRVQETQGQKAKNNCEFRLPAVIADLPIASPKIGLTIWRLREERREYERARILSHPNATKPKQDYQAERIGGQPLLSSGDLVRMSVESPRNGFLYVFDREIASSITMELSANRT
jgi:hypothetical protein